MQHFYLCRHRHIRKTFLEAFPSNSQTQDNWDLIPCLSLLPWLFPYNHLYFTLLSSFFLWPLSSFPLLLNLNYYSQLCLLLLPYVSFMISSLFSVTPYLSSANPTRVFHHIFPVFRDPLPISDTPSLSTMTPSLSSVTFFLSSITLFLIFRYYYLCSMTAPCFPWLRTISFLYSNSK